MSSTHSNDAVDLEGEEKEMSHKPGMECVGADVQIESLKSRAEILEREKDAYRKKAIRLGQWFFAYQEKYKDLDTRSINKWEVDATAMVDEEVAESLEGKEPKS